MGAIVRVRVYHTPLEEPQTLVSEGAPTDLHHPEAFREYVRAVQEAYPDTWEQYLRGRGVPLALLYRGYTYEVVD